MPSLAHSAMVCTTPPTGGGHPHPPSHNTRALNRPSGSRAPSGEQQNPLTCQLEGIRRDLLTKGLSGQATGIVLAAQRTSTQISTSHAGQNGWAGVINNKLIPFTLVKVVDFQSDLFQSGLQYSTLDLQQVPPYHLWTQAQWGKTY